MIFPNPSQNNTTVFFQLNQASSVRTEIRDLAGKSILQTAEEMLPAGNQKLSINLSTLPEGMYLLTVYTDNSSKTFKLVKHK